MKKTVFIFILLSFAFLSGIFSIVQSGQSSVLAKSLNAATNSAQTSEKKAVVVELFTTQSCGSCTVADYYLSRLEESQPIQDVEIITLAHHVDYYDTKNGWRDVFGSAAATARHADYAAALKLPQIFTPHFFIDGVKETGGTNMSKLQFALIDAAKAPKAEVRIKLNNAEAVFKKQKSVILDVEIENLPSRTENADVMIAVTENALMTKIKKGENAGENLKNDSVVRQFARVATINADQNSFKGQAVYQPSDDWKKENVRVVIFVQETESKKILGAGRFRY